MSYSPYVPYAANYTSALGPSRLDDYLARSYTGGSYLASPTRIGASSPLRRSYLGPTTSVLGAGSPTLRRSYLDGRPPTYATSPLHTGYSQAVVSPLRSTAVAAELGYHASPTNVAPKFTYSKVVEPGVVTERQVVEPPVYTTTRHIEEGVETRTILEPSYETRTIIEPTYTTQRIVEHGVETHKVYEPYEVTSTRLVGENLVGGVSQVGHTTSVLDPPVTTGVTGVTDLGVSGYHRPYESLRATSPLLTSPTRRYGGYGGYDGYSSRYGGYGGSYSGYLSSPTRRYGGYGSYGGYGGYGGYSPSRYGRY